MFSTKRSGSSSDIRRQQARPHIGRIDNTNKLEGLAGPEKEDPFTGGRSGWTNMLPSSTGKSSSCLTIMSIAAQLPHDENNDNNQLGPFPDPPLAGRGGGAEEPTDECRAPKLERHWSGRMGDTLQGGTMRHRFKMRSHVSEAASATMMGTEQEWQL